jgi:hypothetical protein
MTRLLAGKGGARAKELAVGVASEGKTMDSGSLVRMVVEDGSRTVSVWGEGKVDSPLSSRPVSVILDPSTKSCFSASRFSSPLPTASLASFSFTSSASAFASLSLTSSAESLTSPSFPPSGDSTDAAFGALAAFS